MKSLSDLKSGLRNEAHIFHLGRQVSVRGGVWRYLRWARH